MAEQKYKSVFISGMKLKLLLLKYMKKYHFRGKKHPLFSRTTKEFIRNNIKLRKKLLLTKTAVFGRQSFSSPAMPGFPSKAYDSMIARGGLNLYSMGTREKEGMETILLAVSNRCQLKCNHCYEAHNLKNVNGGVKTDKWKEVIDIMQSMGVNVIVLTGGEPLLEFEKTVELLEYGNKDLSDFHLHTSGYGLTEYMVLRLKAAGLKAAAVGLDDCDAERFDILRGKNGLFRTALDALEMFNRNGIFTYVNTCVTREFLNSGGLYKFYDLMKEKNVGMIQLLEPRPWGGYINEASGNIFSKEDKAKLYEFVKTVSGEKRYRQHPLIYYLALVEHPDNMGCTMGGVSHMYIDSAGNVNPCVFLPVSFGNINEENFLSIYKKMREVIAMPVRRECPSVALKKTLKDNPVLSAIPLKYDDVKKEMQEVISV